MISEISARDKEAIEELVTSIMEKYYATVFGICLTAFVRKTLYKKDF